MSSSHACTATEQVYSQRLGVLVPRQFQAALARFSLGDFVGAVPVAHGLFGQNVFVTSTQGEYVLRGNPHYPWQFPKEQFGAALLHARTQVPVAHPYLFDQTSDIFGWPYLIMPRLNGFNPLARELTAFDQLNIARALGQNLAELHASTWPFAGDFDLATNTIQPFSQGFAQWIVADIRRWLDKACSNGTATTADDVVWTERVISAAEAALAVEFQPCFVMNDYNPGNVLVTRVHGTWQVTGLFDLMEYYFGDGEADLMRLIATYLDGDQHGERLAQAFVTAYLDRRPARWGFAERYTLYMVRDRLIVWEYGTRPDHHWFPEGQSFRDYAERYTASYSNL
jgi:aminoglycoside phosphotransferase (APT) family kinase protein